MLKKFKLKPIKLVLNGKTISLTGDNINIDSNNFSVDENGKMTCSDAHITGGNINMTGDDTTPAITIKSYDEDTLEMYPSNFYMHYNYSESKISQFLQKYGYTVKDETSEEETNVFTYGITTPTLTQTSREENKKNFEKLENALNILKQTEIYKYNLKSQKDGDKKHIGFVIGKNYKYSHELTAEDDSGKEIGVDNYSMTSVLWKAMQEQQEIIEQLQKEVKELKGGQDK